MAEELPFIDEFDVEVAAQRDAVFMAVARRLGRSFKGASGRVFSRLLGCAHRETDFTVPPLVGQQVNGFRVARVEGPSELVLEGSHRFASYRLSFFIDALDEGRTRLRARTEADFPGVAGFLYRALVIGSGGHGFIVRQTLRVVAAQAVATPRFEMSPTSRFGDRASDYALFRPSYPPAAIDAILDGLAVGPGFVAADIGAGTGIASRLLAERGVRVVAVEPNAEMRESADPHPLVSFQDGAAEATGLGEGSVDLVLCAQVFHWFKPQEALAEFRRILKRPGRLALLVNERADDDEAMSAYNAAIRAASPRELSEGMRSAVDDALLASGFSTAPVSFPHRQTLSREGLFGRARSASYVPKEGPRYDQLLSDLDRLWEDHHDASGLVSLGYRTFVWRVDFKPSPS